MWKGGLIYTKLKGSTIVKLWLKALIKKVKYKKGLNFKKKLHLIQTSNF